jgi:hypothetical protein
MEKYPISSEYLSYLKEATDYDPKYIPSYGCLEVLEDWRLFE